MLIRPMLDTIPPRQPPPLPDLADQARVAALVAAFGSRDVKDRMQAWRDVIDEILKADSLMELAQNERGHGGSTLASQALDASLKLGTELRPVENARRKDLADAINAELASD